MSGQNNLFSDYGSSGNSSNFTSSWPSGESWSPLQTSSWPSGESWSPLQASSWPSGESWSPPQAALQPSQSLKPTEQKSASYQDLVTGKCTLDDIMKEFQMNGLDSPYTPDDNIWSNNAGGLAGMGPSSAYVRQKSWPAPEGSPAPRLRPRSLCAPAAAIEFNANEFTTSTPIEGAEMMSAPANVTTLTAEQRRVLNSLPNAVLFSLLHEMEQARGGDKRPRRQTECRFCKNNGEREKFYSSHSLRDARGRVTCPVLSAFRCRRCGATGPLAHTDTYCPLATPIERMKSAAMMRSVRMASGRRRAAPSVANDYVMFGDTTPSYLSDNQVYTSYAEASPLDPLWAALEKKLLL